MSIQRLPNAALQPFVALVWSSDAPTTGLYARPAREHMLPSGMTHLVFRMTDRPLRISGSPDDTRLHPLEGAVVGGARSRFYVREMVAPSCSVGALLRPGAAAALFGVPADELAERHTSLVDLWGPSTHDLHEQLLEAESGDARLTILETALSLRLLRAHSMHPAIASFMNQLHVQQSIATAVRASGISHRQFVAQFRHTVGLAPKTYLRVLRFQHVLQSLRRGKGVSLASVAVAAGYSDQAHFNRDFLAFSGVTPTTYLGTSPREANHVPVERGASGVW